jgi:hypothetical protein
VRGISRRLNYSGERACLLVILPQNLTNFALIFHIGLFMFTYLWRGKDIAGAVRITCGPTGAATPAVRVEELYSKTLSPCNPVIESCSLTGTLFPREQGGAHSTCLAESCGGVRVVEH